MARATTKQELQAAAKDQYDKLFSLKRYLVFALITAVLLTLVSCTKVTFDGNRTGNSSEFIMEYKILNSTDSQLLDLKAGEIVQADIISDSGELMVSIKKDSGELVYSGVNLPTSSFEIEIEHSGTYEISVTGKRAKGSASFTKK